MKVTLENFRKIQEYKKLGLSQKKTATNLSLTLTSVRKWWDSTEDDLLNSENTRAEYLDNYKEFMLSVISFLLKYHGKNDILPFFPLLICITPCRLF